MDGQARHIEINLGNVLTIGLLSILFDGGMRWFTAALARTNVPGVKQLAVGAQYYYHAA